MKVEFKDVDISVFKVLKEWNKIVKNNNEQPTLNPLDINYYIKDKWWKKLIPFFIYKILFKPNKVFKNCYPSSIDFDFTQQPLSVSIDPSKNIREKIHADTLIFGSSFWAIKDGKYKRLDPTKVTLQIDGKS